MDATLASAKRRDSAVTNRVANRAARLLTVGLSLLTVGLVGSLGEPDAPARWLALAGALTAGLGLHRLGRSGKRGPPVSETHAAPGDPSA